jgi:hypothetical protein
MIHYLDEKDMVYTACFQLMDNSIVRLETTDNVDEVTCPHCIDAILTKWEVKECWR